MKNQNILKVCLMVLTLLVGTAISAAHTLKVKARPDIACTFNKDSVELGYGNTISLSAYTQTGFKFLRWEDEAGSVVSTDSYFQYTMPGRDVTLYAVCEYNPENPGNPNKNYWNKTTGEVIVDDFTPGNLSSAISSAISGSNRTDVKMITVSGIITNNDLGIINNYSNCTFLDLSRVTGVTEIPSYAFDYTNLETVYLPFSIEKIGYRAFASCANLTSLTVYAMTPPTLESYVFSGVPEGLVVYVPAAAIPQYQDDSVWGQFTLLPIQEDIRNISVALPAGTNATDYTQMWLELTNTKNGQRIHYVMTDRTSYTFANIIRNTTWNVTLRNERGDVFGKIENVEVKDEDVAVTFTSLSKPQIVTLSVLTPDGKNVTDQVQVTWTDEQRNYIAQNSSLAGLPSGCKVNYRVVLSQELAMAYVTPPSADYTLKNGGNAITCQLQTIQKIQISGKVKEASTNLPLGGAVISASQTFDGKYSQTLSAKSDKNGVYTMEVAAVPTSLAISASDFISQTLDYTNNEFSGLSEFSVPDITLNSITGATISLTLSYTDCDGETRDWYSDYQNVDYAVYNVTKNHAIDQIHVQYPQIVLMEDVEDGDVLRLTASSLTKSFVPVETTATVLNQKAEASFAIKELGRIQASFVRNSNASVVGSLYDSNRKLIKSMNYVGTNLTISDLADGRYTLVTMGGSDFYNDIYDLDQLPQAGLTKGIDYAQNTVDVVSGVVSLISIDNVPKFDESKFYYTGNNTSFTVNKSSIVVGNYLTLTGHIDFKPEYVDNVSNVNLIVDLPSSCQFVENSVMVGNCTSSYILQGSRITVPLANHTDRVRFCIIPTTGGDYAPSALTQFDIDGETITQPIGSAYYTANDYDIKVPEMITTADVTVSGSAPANAEVSIFADNILIGKTIASNAGKWSSEINLPKLYNYSVHDIFTRITTAGGLELQSEEKSVQYIENAIQLKTVTMSHYNRYLNREIPIRWSYPYPLTGGRTSSASASGTSYSFYQEAEFSFRAEFTECDTIKINNVSFNVFLSNNKKVVQIPATFDEKTGSYVAVRAFGGSALPVNVSVNYTLYNLGVVDNSEHLSEDLDAFTQSESAIQSADNSFDIELIDDEDDYCSYKLQYEFMDSPYDWTIQELDYQTAKYLLHQYSFQHSLSENGNGYTCSYIQESQDKVTMYLIDTEEELAFEISIIDPNSMSSAFRAPKIKIDWAKLAKYSRKEFKKSVRNLKKHYSDPNNWVDDGLSLWGGVLDIIGIKKYIDSRDFNLCFDVMVRYVDQMMARKDALNKQVLKKCKDGSYSMSAEDRDWYLTQLNNIDNSIGSFMNTFGSYVDLYESELAAALWVDVLSMGAGKALGSIAKAGKILKNSKNAKYFQYIIRSSKARERAQSGIELAFSYGVEGLNNFINPEFTDFEKVESDMYKWMDEATRNTLKILDTIERNIKEHSSPCPQDDDDPDDPNDPLFDDIVPIHDPSGYVYEAVASNRLEGVTATAFYKEMVEDMYGDFHENIVKWDAEKYAQENPLFTDEFGMYAWDVPQGMWQVKFEKDGYETTFSEWLPVPPPQLDVNIAMAQNRQPEVKMAHAYEDAVEVVFDKYMIPELLNTDNVTILQNGNPVEGTIKLLNEEYATEDSDVSYASKIRFNALAPFSAQEVTLLVSNRVKSYAGIRMQDDYQQVFAIEKEIKQIVCDSLTVVTYGEEANLTVNVLPAEASKGKMLRINSASQMLLGLDSNEIVLDNEGRAEVTIMGYLPGTSALTFSVDGTDKTAITIVQINQFGDWVAAPAASIASGSTVFENMSVTLSCSTPNATIYYTLDGSCPCDEETRLVYTGPIAIDHDMTIKAMTVTPDGHESNIVEFVYYAVGIENVIADDAKVRVYPSPVKDRLNISANGKTIKTVSITNMGGVPVVIENTSTDHLSIDVCALTTGFYVVEVITESGNYKQFVIKE